MWPEAEQCCLADSALRLSDSLSLVMPKVYVRPVNIEEGRSAPAVVQEHNVL